MTHSAASGGAGGPVRVIFVCTGNSARSQMAEALLRRAGGEAFEVASAGVAPKAVHPLTIRALADVGIDWSAARSKPLAELAGRPFDHVVTVCDNARESCPVLRGGGATHHWSLDDPAAAVGPEAERFAAFVRVREEIAARIAAFVPGALRDRAG